MRIIDSTRAFALALACTASLVAHAETETILGGPDAAWYAGGSVGLSRDSACKPPSGFGSCDENDTAYRIFAGYQVNRYLALEVGYHKLADVTQANQFAINITEAKMVDLAALGMLPVWRHLSLYGRLGIYRSSVDSTTTVVAGPPGGNASRSIDGNGLSFGLGLQYDLNANIGFRAEWMQFQDVPVSGGLAASTTFALTSIGALWRFK